MTNSIKLLFSVLLILFVNGSEACAEGLIVPQRGGVVLLDGQTLGQISTVRFGDEEVPRLAIHPQSPILATLQSGHGLVFWNLPSMTQASRHENSLFKDVVDIAFSESGNELYLLTPKLRGIVVFELTQSKVSGLLPVPGSPPRGFAVTGAGLVVEQEDGVSLLSPDPQKGLLAQLRFPETLSATAVVGEQLFVALEGVLALTSYQLPSGRVVNFLPTAGAISSLAGGPGAGEVIGVDGSGTFQKWAPASGDSRWAGKALGSGAVTLCSSLDLARLYALDESSGTVVSFDARGGTELARTQVVGGVGQPVAFSD